MFTIGYMCTLTFFSLNLDNSLCFYLIIPKFNHFIQYVQVKSTSKCGIFLSDFYLKTQCKLYIDDKTGKRHVIIPTVSKGNNNETEPCTDVFSIDEMKWKKINKDNRKVVMGGNILR